MMKTSGAILALIGIALGVMLMAVWAFPFSADGMGGRKMAKTSGDPGSLKVTVTGVFVARGNGVECPKIRTDDGDLIGISYISPDIPIGTRVEVRGHYAIMTTCRGRVVVAEDVKTP